VGSVLVEVGRVRLITSWKECVSRRMGSGVTLIEILSCGKVTVISIVRVPRNVFHMIQYRQGLENQEVKRRSMRILQMYMFVNNHKWPSGG
jgi:hypothetical protein